LGLQTEIAAIIDRVRGEIGVAVAELPDGQEIQINADKPYRAASVIKVAILYELFRKHEEKGLDLDALHRVDERNISVGGGVIRTLHRPVQLSLKDLATLMIIVSDNSATNELIDVTTMEDVNSTMLHLGLQRTILRRKMTGGAGGEPPIDRDNVMSPRDAIALLREIYSAGHLSRKSCDCILGIMKEQQLKQKIPRYLPENVVFAGKTGTLKGVSNDIGILFLRQPVAVAMMCMRLGHSAYGSDAIAAVGNAVYEHYS